MKEVSILMIKDKRSYWVVSETEESYFLVPYDYPNQNTFEYPKKQAGLNNYFLLCDPCTEVPKEVFVRISGAEIFDDSKNLYYEHPSAGLLMTTYKIIGEADNNFDFLSS